MPFDYVYGEKAMFAVMEKRGALMPVHSKRDIDYLISRGWQIQAKAVPVVEEAEKVEIPQPKKRGRPFRSGK